VETTKNFRLERFEAFGKNATANPQSNRADAKEKTTKEKACRLPNTTKYKGKALKLRPMGKMPAIPGAGKMPAVPGVPSISIYFEQCNPLAIVPTPVASI
jgi:hypothetical protein